MSDVSKPSPGSLRLSPTSQVLTVMFVDVVGFSLSAERMEPSDVFRRLRELLLDMTAIVHRHGGIIDKTLGDGFLGFFGFNLDGSPPESGHIDAAITCALELQQYALDRALQAPAQAGAVYPLRIGINTSPVFIGDVGGPSRVEYTLIGHGVNVAQRLESACETFRIMVSQETLRGWTRFAGTPIRIDKKMVQTKHREELFEAYEINPFEAHPERVQRAMARYRQMSGLKRREDREPLPVGLPVSVHADRVQGTLVNFSRSGLALETGVYFGKGTVLRIVFDLQDPQIKKGLAAARIPASIPAEVRWGAGAGDRYVHGLQLLDLSESQKEVLYRIFSQVKGRGVLPEAG